MDEDTILAMAGVLAVLLGGMTVLIPVLGFTLRFALKPMVETWERIRQSQANDQQNALLARQVALLETELQQVQHTLQSLTDSHEFQRQLTERAPAPLPGPARHAGG